MLRSGGTSSGAVPLGLIQNSTRVQTDLFIRISSMLQVAKDLGNVWTAATNSLCDVGFRAIRRCEGMRSLRLELPETSCWILFWAFGGVHSYVNASGII